MMNTRKMVTMGFLSALSLVLMLIIRFPIIPGVPYLEYEPADVPILIGTMIYGPISGLIITLVVSVIQAFTVSAASGWVGGVMHLLATGGMVLVTGLIYKKLPTLKGTIIALVAGCLTMTLIMIPANLFFTVVFFNTPYEVVKGMLVPAIIPFNLIKSGANSVLTLLIFKSLEKYLRKK